MTRDYPKSPGPIKPPIETADDMEEAREEIEKMKKGQKGAPKKKNA